MYKDLIMNRCRKVYVPLQDNTIFGYGETPEEFDGIHIFRKEENAQKLVSGRRRESSLGKPGKAFIKHEIATFYMVPASLVEK